MKNKSNLLIIVIITIILSSLIKYFLNNDNIIKPTIEIKLSSEKYINQYELYINSLQKSPELIEGVKKSESFTISKQIDENINFLRIDFGDAKDNLIKIYSLNIFYQDQNYKIDPTNIVLWKTNDLEIKHINKNFIEYRSIGNDPFIYSTLNIKFENFNNNKLSFVLNKYFNEEIRLVLLKYSLVFILIFALSNTIRNEFKSNLSLLAGILTSILTFTFMPQFPFTGDFATSIGRSSYNDGFFSISIVTKIYASLFIGCLIIYLGRYFYKPSFEYIYKIKSGNHATPFFCILLIILFFIVDLNYEKQLYLSAALGNDWDGSNINYWTYLINLGEIPYRDFWYPYSGMFLAELKFPTGILISTFYKIFIYSSLIYLFYKVVNRNFLVCFSFILFVILGREVNLFWGSDRYLLSVLVLLSFVNYYNSYRSSNNLRHAQIVFIINFLFVIIYELPQLIYVTPGLIFIVVYDYFINNNFNFIKNIIKYLLPLIIFILLIVFLFLYNFDVIPGLISFYSSTGDMSQGSQVTFDPRVNFLSANFNFLIYLSTFSIFFIAFLRIISKSKDISFTYICIGFSSISLMVLLKHIVRPMDWQFLIIPFVFFIIYIIYTNRKLNNLDYVLISLMVAIFISFPFSMNIIANYAKHIYGGLSRAKSTFEYLNIDNIAISKFSLFKFDVNSDEHKVVNFILSKIGKDQYYYILSDSPNLYINIKGHHPYHTNSYNMSPLTEQIKNLNWLTIHQPQYVVLDRHKLNFDLVPNNIRNPLIYKFIVNNYSFLLSHGKYDILIKNKISNLPDFDYWTKLLGDSVDLKFIPMYSKPYSCGNKNSDSNVADIHLLNPSNFEGDVIIRFHYKSGRDFYVKFTPSTKKSNYWINLNRLWFYNESMLKYIRPESSNITINIFPCAVSNSRLY